MTLVARRYVSNTSQREITSRAVNGLRMRPGRGRTSNVSTWTKLPGAVTAYARGFRIA